MEYVKHPKFLYKILSLENWKASQQKGSLILPPDDEVFIHLAKEEQLEKILEKFWSHASSYVLLKVETQKLNGDLVLESNPGGMNKYYHLYNGSISLSSIVESKIVDHAT